MSTPSKEEMETLGARLKAEHEAVEEEQADYLRKLGWEVSRTPPRKNARYKWIVRVPGNKLPQKDFALWHLAVAHGWTEPAQPHQ